MQNFKDQPICVDDASLNAWRQDDLVSAVAILLQETQGVAHHRLANLALVRARLKQWDLAEYDARASIQIQPTILGHIALSIVLGGQGELASAKQEFNRVFLRREPKNECLLLLIKSIIILMAGERDEAVRRVADLVEACAEADKALCRAVQAQMQLLVGQTAVNEQDYEKALKSFASAGASAPFFKFPELETISLMFGWDFDSSLLVIRQQTCEALYAASRISEAVGSLLSMLNEFGAEMKASVKLSNWLENFTRRCVKALEAAADTALAAGKHDEAIVRNPVASSLNHLSDSVSETIESFHSKIAHTKQQLRAQRIDSQHRVDNLVQILQAHEQQDQCEALYAEGHIIDAAAFFLAITNTVSEEVRANRIITDWLAKFKSKCISTLEIIGDKASGAEKQDEAVTAYSIALLLTPSTFHTLLVKWASMVLIRSSANEALTAAAQFKLPRFLIYRAICDILEEDGRVSEAVQCFRQMQNELGKGTDNHDRQAQSEHGEGFQRRRSDATDSFHTMTNITEKEVNSVDETEWAANFKVRCLKTLEERGDVAMDSVSYEDAVIHYTTALSLDPISTDLLTKRSKARAGIGLWQDSLEDANAAIKLDPSSPHGYGRRHAALLGAHQYDEAINAYNDMLLKFEQSPDPVTQELRNHYVSSSQTMATIRHSAKLAQRDTPLVLVNTKTGRLYDQHERLDEFEADPKFKELAASMTTVLDHSRISRTVREYFRYATLSHTWEGAEPLFHDVLQKSVHKLAASPIVSKLVMFCMTVREAGLRWAWCDTCCINKTDGSVLQESLTSMFQWYHESVLTIVHLKGVRSDSDLRALVRCLWNTRAWTLQEFFASRVIRFYTEDWKLYHPEESTYNHKDSLVIMDEMAAANGVDVQVLLSLRPGSENVRQKLYLAATRTASRQEDIAYSLFGIFDVSIPVNYGEGQQRALSRLLQEVLTRSGDVTILAWTGRASDYNSCLPAEIGVYREPVSPYIPSPMEGNTMDALVTELRTSPGYPDSAVMLYDRVVGLPSPRLVSSRLNLSCILFPLKVSPVSSGGSQHIYRTTTPILGNVEIKTTEDLSSLKNLVLVHPWLTCLLDPALPFEDLVVDGDAKPLTPLDGDRGDRDSDAFSPSTSHTAFPSYDKLTRALRLFTRLRQPFGALLLVSLSHNEYKRVASDHPIVVQLVKEVTPRYLEQKIRTLDIL